MPSRVGVHSPRLIQERAREIVETADFGVELDFLGQLALNEVASLSATIEAICGDLDEQGLTDKRDHERYILRRRDSLARRFGEAYDRLLNAVERAQKRENTLKRKPVPPDRWRNYMPSPLDSSRGRHPRADRGNEALARSRAPFRRLTSGADAIVRAESCTFCHRRAGVAQHDVRDRDQVPCGTGAARAHS